MGPRASLENDEHFVQIIPYAVVANGKRVVAYRRSGAGGEGRLRGLLSIGFGGHIDLPDIVALDGNVSLEETLFRACAREVEEELADVDTKTCSVVGTLFDTRTPVGRVHLGVLIHVQLVKMPEPLATTDPAIADLEAWTTEALTANATELEEWSKMALGWVKTVL